MKKARGFTLVELMITLVIAGILVTLAIPSFITTIQNNRITAQANELITALNLARSEAVKRGDNVTVCASSNSATCTGGWADGWIVFQDVNDNGALDAGTDTLLRVWEGLQGNASLTSGVTSLTYDRLGATNETLNFSLSIPDCTGEQGRIIQINNSGRINVSHAACS